MNIYVEICKMELYIDFYIFLNNKYMCINILIHIYIYTHIRIAQPCPTLCNPMDCSLPGSSVHGIFQARILERIAISYSRESSQPKDQTLL